MHRRHHRVLWMVGAVFAVGAVMLSLVVFADRGDMQLTATMYSDVIRFEAEGVASLRLTIYDLAENELWSSGLTLGDFIDWDRTNAAGERLANGYYLYLAQGWDDAESLILNKAGKVVLLPGDQVELKAAPSTRRPPSVEDDREEPIASTMTETVNDSLTVIETAGNTYLNVDTPSDGLQSVLYWKENGTGRASMFFDPGADVLNFKTYGADAIAFLTDGDERMRITAAGRVQVGSAVGNAYFDVSAPAGSQPVLYWKEGGAGRASMFYDPAGSELNFKTYGSDAITFVTGGVDRMTLSGTGALTVGAYTLPTADGTNGQALCTNGSGTVSWQTVSGGGSGYWTASGDDISNNNSGAIVLNSGGRRFLHEHGSNNVFLGDYAGNTTTIGFGMNVAVGEAALNAIGNAAMNTAVGGGALQHNTTANSNTAVGYAALHANETGEKNTAVGAASLGSLAPASPDVGDSNTAVGYGAMTYSTTGKQNTAVGCEALGIDPGNTGDNNTAVGYVALYSNTSGVENTALGQNALYNNTTAHYNTAVGQAALYNATSGGDNTGIGQNAGDAVGTGTQNTLVGSLSDVSAGTLTNATALGFGAVVDASNKVQIGNTSVTEVEIEGIHGSTSASGIAVYVNSDGVLGTATSSARFKTGIADLSAASDVLYDLRPVTFAYRPEIDPLGITQYGLIAEEVAEVAPDLVAYDDAGDPYTVRYGQLVPLLLNEVREHEATIAELRALVDDLSTRLVELESASQR